MRFKVHFNHKDWVRRAYDCDDMPKIEHYHPALTWCSQNKIKYKVKKVFVQNNKYGYCLWDYDPYDVKWDYQVMFYSEHDAQTFINHWGEHI